MPVADKIARNAKPVVDTAVEDAIDSSDAPKTASKARVGPWSVGVRVAGDSDLLVLVAEHDDKTKVIKQQVPGTFQRGQAQRTADAITEWLGKLV